MKPSSAPKKTSRSAARNATLMNLLGTPGLGSLMAGRWLAGSGQLVLALAGFTLVVVWFFKEISPYYSQMFSDTPPPPVGFKMLAEGGGLFAGAWVWSLVTSLSLMRATAKVRLASLESFAAGQVQLDAAKIILALGTVPAWRKNGDVIARTFVFQDFPAAMKFVNAVAELAEQAQHHPEVDIRWNQVTLALTTHDAGGLTEKDFALARQCDTLAAER